MFIQESIITPRDIERELTLVNAGMTTPFMAIPIKPYLSVCMSMGIKDYYEPESLGSHLITQVIGIGGLTSKNADNKQLGSVLFPSSTWTRYKKIFNDGERRAITSRSMVAIVDAVERLPHAAHVQFWKTVIDWRMHALRASIRNLMLFDNKENGQVTGSFAIAIVDVCVLYKYLLGPLASCPATQVHKRKDYNTKNLYSLACIGRNTLSNSAYDTMSRAEAYIGKMWDTRSLGHVVKMSFDGIVCQQELEDLMATYAGKDTKFYPVLSLSLKRDGGDSPLPESAEDAVFETDPVGEEEVDEEVDEENSEEGGAEWTASHAGIAE